MQELSTRTLRGFTFLEISIVLLIIAILIAILLPVYQSRSQGQPKTAICLSNMRQIGLAFMQYAQDNNDVFPPATGRVFLSDGTEHEQQWGLTTSAFVNGKQEPVPAILAPYIKDQRVFCCPSVQQPKTALTYLYNDLAANEPLSDVTAPAVSVIASDSEDRLRNTGHSRSLQSGGERAEVRALTDGKTPLVFPGAAVGKAAVRHSHHNNGCVYGFADGHAKWMKTETVYFPPRSSNSISHREAKTGKLLGPDPAGATQSERTYRGKLYKATFHLR